MNPQLYTPNDGAVDTPWTFLAGTILDGGYEIKELLHAEHGKSVFRVRILGDRDTNATVTFLALNEQETAEQLAIWQSTKVLRSPTFSAPLSFGTHVLGDSTVPYVVLVRADETLAGVLRERPLEAEEASETLLSIARALAHLHRNGLIHGFVSPEHVLAIGQDIKLSGHTARAINTSSQPYLGEPLYVAPEGSGSNNTPAADVWCLGATLFQALTQTVCDQNSTQRVHSLPGRLGFVAQRCLETEPTSRATASEVIDMLEGRIPVTLPKAAPLAAAAAATSVSGPSPRIIKVAPAPERLAQTPAPPLPNPVSRVNQRFEQRHARDLKPDKPKTVRPPIWLFAAGGLLLALIVLWLALPRHTGPAAVQPAQPTPQASIPPQSTGAAQTPAASPTPNVSKQAGADTSSVAPVGEPVSGDRIWRVVVYAYHRSESAEQKAQSINQRHPELNASVFSPKGRSVFYVVTVGSPMTREEAVRYRSQAIRSGMPRDTYIQNYRPE
ncbi:MAG TPA: hypothetical protein VH302_04110 [Bryobacteraceae bacterium]|jgi:serine/threonine protein kinase|nr:hypothetical protein [Bryobacteraceae bacterium]